MAPLLLLLNATKFVGVAGIIAVAVEAIAYRSFRKENLAPFENPIDEDEDVLARFAIDTDEDDGGFFFSLATAPAHVEDKLNDAWLEFAQEDASKEATSTVEPEVRREDAESCETVDVSEGAKKSEIPTINDPEPLSSPQVEDAQTTSEENLQHPATNVNRHAGDGGSPIAPSSGVTMSEWEVVSDSSDKDKADDGNGSNVNISAVGEEGSGLKRDVAPELQPKDAVSSVPTSRDAFPVSSVASRRKQKNTTTAAALQFNPPRKARQLGKVAMEAMLRGIEKVSEVVDESGEDTHNVAAWQNAFHPEERLRFWSDPDKELKLAQDTNVTVFRMGVDWSRIMPVEPVNGIAKAVNWEAVKRYKLIIENVRARGMRVMLTLFHHSLPIWAAKYGGWKKEKTIKYFVEFTRLVVEQYGNLVEFWVTFNEPHVFAMLTYCAGAWPGGDPNLVETATSVLPKGVFKIVMSAMADAHTQAYDIIHDICKKMSRRAKVGVSHHVSFMRPYGLFDVLIVKFSDWMTRYAFFDDIAKKLDYLGINYYGQEVVSAPGLKHVEDDEYSESGRGVYPDGLYRLLISFHERYKKFGLPFIVTENGVSDTTDYIRRPYIVEHLLAIRAAMAKGVPVQGYCFWTTSDNWEWADGYGPKFGLVAVDRLRNLARTPRPSYYLFAEIAKTGIVTKKQRDQAWEELQTVVEKGETRPFCRAVDKHGLMYSGGLDVPIDIPYAERDWRFGHYQVAGLQDPLSRFVRFIFSGAFLGRKKPSTARRTPPAQETPKGVPRLNEIEEEALALA